MPFNRFARVVAQGMTFLAVGLMSGCMSVPSPQQPQAQIDSGQSGSNRIAQSLSVVPAQEAWQHFEIPGKKPTQFVFADHDGRPAIEARADASASMLRHRVRVEPAHLGTVAFSWKVPELIDRADMGLRELDDSPVRVVLVFEGDRSKFSLKNSMLSEMSLALTGEPLPYATLMYVWCNKRPVGSVIVNPRTDRIRKLVAESGPRRLSHWRDYTRNIRADYERAFGEPPGALLAVGVMTDSDNTRSMAHAWYGGISLSGSTRSDKGDFN